MGPRCRGCSPSRAGAGATSGRRRAVRGSRRRPTCRPSRRRWSIPGSACSRRPSSPRAAARRGRSCSSARRTSVRPRSPRRSRRWREMRRRRRSDLLPAAVPEASRRDLRRRRAGRRRRRRGSESYRLGLEILLALKRSPPKSLHWREAPYEFVADRPAIDLLTGSDRLPSRHRRRRRATDLRRLARDVRSRRTGVPRGTKRDPFVSRRRKAPVNESSGSACRRWTRRRVRAAVRRREGGRRAPRLAGSERSGRPAAAPPGTPFTGSFSRRGRRRRPVDQR